MPQISEKWVLQIREKQYRRCGKQYEIWQTISKPLAQAAALRKLTTRDLHPSPHRILTGVQEATVIFSKVVEVVACPRS